MQNAKKVLLVGAGGMLGREIEAALGRGGFDVVCASRSAQLRIDIADVKSCRSVVSSTAPDIIINCAAQANVDWCEQHEKEAFAVNAEGAGNLARAACEAGAKFIHISTDYVFNGKGENPYNEDDAVGPINIYGCSKLEGERLVIEVGGDFAILRVCALYGLGGSNFVSTIAQKILEGQELKVVSDQITRPTATVDVARAMAGVLTDNLDALNGVFHVAAEGFCSWYEFACEICNSLGANAEKMVTPVKSAEFVRPAPRPEYSVFDTSKFSALSGTALPCWKESLHKYLAQNYS